MLFLQFCRLGMHIQISIFFIIVSAYSVFPLEASSITICVSGKHGKDSAECFYQQQPSSTCCETLIYATSNVPIQYREEDLHIQLYEGEIHLLNQTLNIRQNVTLSSNGKGVSRSVVTLNETSSSINYALDISLADARLTLENLEFVNLKDMVYVTKSNSQIVVRNCRFDCQGCLSTFFQVTSSAIRSKITISKSYFLSDKYLIYSASPDTKITISDSTLTGSRIYMKNLKEKVNNIEVTLTNITATGKFKYYIVKQYGYFKEIRIDQLSLWNTQIQQQAVYLRYSTNKELANNAIITNIKVTNSSNLDTNFFDIQRCQIRMENITVISSTLTSTIKLTRAVGNLSSINATYSYMRHLVAALYTTINLQNVSVDHCQFENVTYKDMRYGRYSPMAHKALLFADYSQITCSSITAFSNDFGWNLVYLTDSTLHARAMQITKNFASGYMFENADNSHLLITHSSVTENTVRLGVFQNFYSMLNISHVDVVGNKPSLLFYYFSMMFAESTHISIDNFQVCNNSMVKIFRLRKSPSIIRSVTFSGNLYHQNIIIITHGTLHVNKISFQNNRGSEDRQSVFSFDQSNVYIGNSSVVGNLHADFLMRGYKSVIVAEGLLVTDNQFRLHVIHIIEGVFTLNGGIFKRNWALSILMMELSDSFISNVVSYGNTITGNHTRFLMFDAYISKINLTGINQLQLRNISVTDRLDHASRNQAATFSITAYFCLLYTSPSPRDS